MSKAEQIEVEIEARISALVTQIARDTLHITSHRQVRELIVTALMRTPWLGSGRRLRVLLAVGNARDELLQAERMKRCMNAGEPIAVEKPARPAKADMAFASRQKALQAEYDAVRSQAVVLSRVDCAGCFGWGGR